MANLIGTTVISGITSSVSGRVLVPWLQNKSSDVFYGSGAIGFSTLTSVAGQTWHVIIYSRIADVDIPIAGLSSLNSASTTGFIPLLRADGVTQTSYLGVPRPSKLDVIGSSAGVGITFGIAIGFAFNNSP